MTTKPPNPGYSVLAAPPLAAKGMASAATAQVASRSISLAEPLVLDGLVPPAFVRAFHTDLRDNGTFGYGRVASSADESIKAWGLNICTDYRVLIPDRLRPCILLFKLVEDRLRELGLLTENWRFFRIGADARTEGQAGYIHLDHVQHNMLSVLYYVNSVWKPEWNGPTLFFSDDTPSGGLCHLHPPMAAVDYTPGRFAVFPSRMLHSATAPTDGNTGLRITLSFVVEVV